MRESKEITVNNIMSYVASKGAPISGLAMMALLSNFTPDTVIERDILGEELYNAILDWKELI
ncbi:hypothetical protein LCGC14_1953580 [marine sediment metagenome]|uniref:Uncharacterized protein n=1 Tax=marine sediment metagenome TaxID=412755 RepID=A0A0F9G520_9ZZZZ